MTVAADGEADGIGSLRSLSLALIASGYFAIVLATTEASGRAVLLNARDVYAHAYADSVLAQTVRSSDLYSRAERLNVGADLTLRRDDYEPGIGTHELRLIRLDVHCGFGQCDPNLIEYDCALAVDDRTNGIRWERKVNCLTKTVGRWSHFNEEAAVAELTRIADYLAIDDSGKTATEIQGKIERRLRTRLLKLPVVDLELSASGATWALAVLCVSLTIMFGHGLRRAEHGAPSATWKNGWITFTGVTLAERALAQAWILATAFAPVVVAAAIVTVLASLSADGPPSPLKLVAVVCAIAAVPVALATAHSFTSRIWTVRARCLRSTHSVQATPPKVASISESPPDAVSARRPR